MYGGLGGMYFDPTMVFLIPAILLSLYAQTKVSSTTSRYFKIRSMRGFTGAQVARRILDRNGLTNVPINPIRGSLTDHYDPRNRSLSLSEEVYYGTSITSVAVAAHECGHAIQHQKSYAPLNIRSFIAPSVSIAANLSWIFIMAGLFFTRGGSILNLGIGLFSLSVIFALITLPVEFNASKRALGQLEDLGIVDESELSQSRAVLNAAAMTYVAAAFAAISQLLRLLIIADRRR